MITDPESINFETKQLNNGDPHKWADCSHSVTKEY